LAGSKIPTNREKRKYLAARHHLHDRIHQFNIILASLPSSLPHVHFTHSSV
jgi:hypothetical protein